MKGNFHAGFGEKYAETHLWKHMKVRCVLTLPVYNGRLGSDWEMSLDSLRRLERIGITTIGIYLGNDPDDLSKLRQLFSRLVVSTGKELPEKLGNVLRSFA